MSRLSMDFKNIDETANDLVNEFSYVNLKQIREALRKGSLGYYGKTYKLSTQEVCVWVREYLKCNKTKLML